MLRVIVKPGKKSDRIEKEEKGWQVSIRARPQEDQANRYLVRYLSNILRIPPSNIQIKRGHHSRIKQIEISADEQEVLEKLNRASEMK